MWRRGIEKGDDAMIMVFAGASEEVNEKVRDWLMFHGFFYYSLSPFVKGAKKLLGGTQRDVLVVEKQGGNYWSTMRVREGSWEEKDEMYERFRVRRSMKLQE